jgi:spermidine synthase
VSFGNGIATGALSRHGIPRIQAVELVAAQVEAARLYARENRGVLGYPGLAIAIDDGRNYVLRSDEAFDIITADSTHPINTSSWALFTLEFYQQVRERLADDGVFIQWLPFHDLSLDDYRSIIATFRTVFPDTTLWYGGGPHTFMLSTPRPIGRGDLGSLVSIARASGVGDDLQDGDLLRRALLMERDDVARYVAGAPIVRDDTAFFVPAVEMERILDSLAAFRTREDPP